MSKLASLTSCHELSKDSLSHYDLFHDDLIIAKKGDVEAVEWKGDVVWTYHQGTSRGG